MSAHCETCRWWLAQSIECRASIEHELGEAYEVYARPDYEERRIIAPHTTRQCQSPALRFHEVPAENGAAVCDGSEYWAALFTGPKFGCTNHESL